MRKKYKEQLARIDALSSAIRKLRAQVGEVKVLESAWSGEYWPADGSLHHRVTQIERQHEIEAATAALEAQVAELTKPQRKRYNQAIDDGHDHEAALLIARECCT
jgi:hypothetical protein